MRRVEVLLHPHHLAPSCAPSRCMRTTAIFTAPFTRNQTSAYAQTNSARRQPIGATKTP